MSVRPVVLVLPGEPVTCRAGHALPEDASPARVRACATCGAHAWVISHGDGARSVVDVDATDGRILATLTRRDARDYLGLARERPERGPVSLRAAR